MRFLFLTLAATAVALVQVSCSAPTSRPLRVACLGDSITEGAGTNDPARESYPAQLGPLLGAGYDVRNFGVGGSTLLDFGDKPYRQQDKFAAALAFQPDIVVISLGTNDSKPQNWKFSGLFAANYVELIRQLRALPSHPRIYLCQPIPAWPPSNWGISPVIIEKEIRPMVADLARAEHTELIDLFTPMKPHPEFVPDYVHPDARGAAVMAKTVAAALKAAK